MGLQDVQARFIQTVLLALCTCARGDADLATPNSRTVSHFGSQESTADVWLSKAPSHVVLLQIIQGEVKLHAKADYASHANGYVRGRIGEVVQLIKSVVKADQALQQVAVEFMVDGEDGTCIDLSAELSPVLCPYVSTSAASGQIPFPMWSRGEGQNLVGEWARTLSWWQSWYGHYQSLGSTTTANYRFETLRNDQSKATPWDQRQSKAVFRGSVNYDCADATDTRVRAIQLSRENGNLLDARPSVFKISTNGRTDGACGVAPNTIPMEELSAYKYTLHLGQGPIDSNNRWGDRLRVELMGSNALLIPASGIEFFSSQFEAGEHYIGVKTDLSDLLEKIRWAQQNDGQVQAMVRKMQAKADEQLSADAIRKYAKDVVVRLMSTTKYQVLPLSVGDVRLDRELIPKEVRPITASNFEQLQHVFLVLVGVGAAAVYVVVVRRPIRRPCRGVWSMEHGARTPN